MPLSVGWVEVNNPCRRGQGKGQLTGGVGHGAEAKALDPQWCIKMTTLAARALKIHV